jgi:hypothetical protein
VIPTDTLVRRFCALLRASGFEGAALLESALHAIDLEGDGNREAAAMWEAIRGVLRQPGRSIGERLDALSRVLNNKGLLRLPQDLGWT